MSKTIRILIVDDHAVVRKGLSAILETEQAFEVVGEAANGNQAVWKARSLQPDVILMDLVMPEKDGIAAIKEIKKDDPQAKILVITSFSEDEKVFPAIKAGALGYLLKDSSPDELMQAIQEIYQGKASLHPTIARKLIMELKQDEPKSQPSEQVLTAREVDVLNLIAHGLSNQEIANQLMVSETTVRFHVSNILSKLHLANRTQAVLYALKEGYAKLDDL
ncbi:MAG TPA: response regulator transcription factor [Chloroflexi bacterium]|nr:response regulator transcription factor [Chloroflexota bacterium]